MGKEKKKHKKTSHKKRKSAKCNSDSSNSSVEEWVEMNSVPESVPQCEKPDEMNVERTNNENDWLINPSLFPCVSRNEMRKKRENNRDKNEEDKYMLDKLGQTDRELNPYWKYGGSGLPQENQVTRESLRQASVTVGDQGVAWLRKALQRAKEQAVEQGHSLEQVVAERWGSLEKLENMIAEAENREVKTTCSKNQSTSNYKSNRDNSKDKSKEKSRDGDRNRSKNSHLYENKKYSNKITEGKARPYNESRDSDSKQKCKYDRNSNSQNKFFKKPKDSESDSSDYHESYKKHKKSSGEQKKNRFIKPCDINTEEKIDLDTKYGKNCKKESKFSKNKLSNKMHKSSSSNTSEDGDHSTESDSRREGRSYNYDKRRRKADIGSNNKQSKRRNDSSSSSTSSEDEHRRSYNTKNCDKKKQLYHSQKKEVKKMFMKPQNGSDDDSLTSSNQRHSNKSKLNSSSSTKRWRKKTRSPTKEDKVLNDDKEDLLTLESANKTEEDRVKPRVEKPILLTDKEMNDLGAKLVKAELLGNQELAKELKAKLDGAREAKANAPKEKEEIEQVVILTHTDSKGFTRPVSLSGTTVPTAGRRKAKKVETHAGGKRMRYFADDDKYSLQEMFQREKLSTVEDSNAVFANLASKGVGRNDSARDMDDLFEETARVEEADGRKHAREKQQAIEQSKRTARSLENCQWCLESKKMLKHLIIAMGQTCYLCVPPFQSITEHHCLLVPSHHTPCATQLDEDVWRELQDFRKSIVQMFLSQDEDVVFFESARCLNKYPHMIINCVPMPKESGDLAPIYFKKAIQECEMEWSNNKKLVELKGRDVRRAIPRGLPYFAVDFGMDSGFAHVIEDERLFPQNFAQEIIGGMLDLDHNIWRKQRKQTFEEQSRKVIQLNKLWSEFDCTKK